MKIFDNGMSAIYYDAEFTGLHRNTTLISIGLVSEHGAIFYAEFNDYDTSQVTPWIEDNVIQHLPYNQIDHALIKVRRERGNTYDVKMKGDRQSIRTQLLEWIQAVCEDNHSSQVQFYTDCYAYDWVLLNDLICDNGQALNLPEYINYMPMDLTTLLQFNGIDPDITREDFVADMIIQLQNTEPFSRWGVSLKHNSLWDAAICKCCFSKLIE